MDRSRCPSAIPGVGLPSLAANEIFDAFFTTKPHSIGIGLSISRSIIEEHGGRLWAITRRAAQTFASLCRLKASRHISRERSISCV
jgi:K+-sensing histidine kinase KdpD